MIATCIPLPLRIFIEDHYGQLFYLACFMMGVSIVGFLYSILVRKRFTRTIKIALILPLLIGVVLMALVYWFYLTIPGRPVSNYSNTFYPNLTALEVRL